MKDTELDKNELYRLASLIGCEPEDEERHRKQLLEYILSHYIAKSEVETDIIGEDFSEGDGWDYFFSEDDKCCPGDDFAEFGNAIKAEQRLKLRGGK